MIPWKITKDLVKVMEKNKTDAEDADVILAKFNKILENMNVHNRCVQVCNIVGYESQFPCRKSLFHLMRHLDKVLANSKDDKVTADKLAISIGPSLRWENTADFHF